jgi:hypothetical protein
MAGSFRNKNDDSIDISELASLNEDISDDFLDQLQDKLTMDASSFAKDNGDDSTLFEEPAAPEDNTANPEAVSVEETLAPETPAEQNPPEEEKKEEIQVNQSFDDNFIKKYKAKLNKKAQTSLMNGNAVNGAAPTKYMQEQESDENVPIENLSNGNITEHPLTTDQKEYNESLDFLDGNVKYSKYVIYIDPKNVDFIDGLTVKERKNLINGILRQQDDISITKQRFALIQTIIRQVVIAVLTISISIPVVYYVINASLEATIDNHRRSQTIWQTLYKENGKIKQN